MIRAVFRVQCDGPCKGWLSVPPHLIGRDFLPEALTIEPTAVHAGNWPGERAARIAAQSAGWVQMEHHVNGKWRCPTCAANPLDTPPMMSDLEICSMGTHMLTGLDETCACQRVLCVCTHPRSTHNVNGLCVALPGVLGCGCMGWLEASR